MSVEHHPGEPQSVGDPEELLALKEDLLKAWERLPAEHQASMALALLNTVREGEWGPWLQEGVQTWPMEPALESHQPAEPTTEKPFMHLAADDEDFEVSLQLNDMSADQITPGEKESMDHALWRMTHLFNKVVRDQEALGERDISLQQAYALLADRILDTTYVFGIMADDFDDDLSPDIPTIDVAEQEAEEHLDPRHFFAAYVLDGAQARQQDVLAIVEQAQELGYSLRYWWLSEALELEGFPDRLIVCVHHPSSDENAGMDLYEALEGEQVTWDALEAASVDEYRTLGKRLANTRAVEDAAGVPLFPQSEEAEPTLSFTDWLHKVDLAVQGTAGCSIFDLPDCAYHTMFEDGLSPDAAAKQALNEIGFSKVRIR